MRDTMVLQPPRRMRWPSARAATQREPFVREQEALGAVWTCLGMASDVAEDGHWFRAGLGGRSVFVLRFGREILAFENRCAHRGYPRVRRSARRPVVCGFHHRRYDKEGLALGIPVCDVAFGVAPRALDAWPRLSLLYEARADWFAQGLCRGPGGHRPARRVNASCQASASRRR